MAKGITVPVVQSGLEASIEAAAKKAGPLNLSATVDPSSFKRLSQPLGRVSGLATEFEKSIAASNARVIAFGASVGIINGVQNAFASLVKTTIEVEKSLVNIAVISGKTAEQLQPFSKALFEIANNTAQSFATASEAALEFSRQGLSLEETLKRTQDALTLTRFTSLSAAEAVDVLTAAANSFGETGITTSEILNKLVAVDTKFAVSAEDLAKGLSRAGSIAQEVGVNFDELNAIVTIAQERTARGGAVIGNAFKTIFSRIRSDETIKALQSIGIYSFDAEGRLKPVVSLLEELAGKINTLGETKKIEVLEAIASKYNINILTALVDDLSSTASKFREARDVSAGAQNEAYQRQIELNQTLDAIIIRVTNSAAQLADTLGKIGVTDSLKSLLSFFENILTGINDVIDSEGIGGTIAKGLISGISGVFFKIGIPLLLAIFVKLTKDIAQFGTESLKTILGINKEVRERQALEQAVVNTLIKDQQVMASILSLSGDRRKQEEYLLGVYNRQVAALQQVQNIAATVAPALQAAGLSATSGTVKKRAAEGYLPAQEAADVRRGVGGADKNAKVVKIPNFSFGGGKKGTMYANSSEYVVPNYNGGDGTAIFNKDMVRKYGMPENAKKINAASGYVPNFADGKYIYDSDRLPADKNALLKKILASKVKKNLILGPAGTGKTTFAAAGGTFITKPEDVDKAVEIDILSGAARTKDGGISANLESIISAVNVSGGKVSYLYAGNMEIIARRIGRQEKGVGEGDLRSEKQIAGTKYAPLNQFDFIDKVKSKAKNFGIVKNAATGYIPNFAQKAQVQASEAQTEQSDSITIADARGRSAMLVPDKKNEQIMEAHLNKPLSFGFQTKDKGKKLGVDYVKYHTYGLNQEAFQSEGLKKSGDLTNIEADVQAFGLDIAKKYSYEYAAEYSKSLGGPATGIQISDVDVRKAFLASKGAVSGFSSLGGGIFETAIRTGVQGEINKDLLKAQQAELGSGKLDFKVTDIIKRLFGVNRGETDADSKIEGNPKSTGRAFADQIAANSLYSSTSKVAIKNAAAGYIPNFAKKEKTVSGLGQATMLLPSEEDAQKVNKQSLNLGVVPTEEKSRKTADRVKFRAYGLSEKGLKNREINNVPKVFDIVKDAISKTGAEIVNAFDPLSEKINGKAFYELYKPTEGAKGSLSAVAGSVFEVAIQKVANPKQNKKASNDQNITFDVTSLTPDLRQLFGITTSEKFADYKISEATKGKFADQIIKNTAYKKASAMGYIPNYAEKLSEMYDWDGTIIPKISGKPEEYIQSLQKLQTTDLLPIGKELAASKAEFDIATIRPIVFREPIKQTAQRLGLKVGKIFPVGSMFDNRRTQGKRGERKLYGPERKALLAEGTGRSIVDDEEANLAALGSRGINANLRNRAAFGFIPNFAEGLKQQDVLAPSGQFYDLDTADALLAGSSVNLDPASPAGKGLGQELKKKILASARRVYGPKAQVGISRLPGRREAFTSAVLANPALADDFIALQKATTGGVGPAANTPDALAKFNNPTPFDPTPWPAIRATGGKARATKKVGPTSLTAAFGFIPNFADPLKEAVDRELSAGIKPSQVRVTRDDRLMTSRNPQGLAVINTRDEPNGKIPNDFRERGMRAAMASRGFVPNFADEDPNINVGGIFGKGSNKVDLSGIQTATTELLAKLKNSAIESDQFNTELESLTRAFNELKTTALKKLDNSSENVANANKNAADATKRYSDAVKEKAKAIQAQKITPTTGEGATGGGAAGRGKGLDIGKFLVFQSAVVGATSAVQSFAEEGSKAALITEGVSAGLTGVGTAVALVGSGLGPVGIAAAALATALVSAAPLFMKLYEAQKDPATRAAESLDKLARQAEKTGQQLTPENILAAIRTRKQQEQAKEESVNIRQQVSEFFKKQDISIDEEGIGTIVGSLIGSTGGVTRENGRITGINETTLRSLVTKPGVIQKENKIVNQPGVTDVLGNPVGTEVEVSRVSLKNLIDVVEAFAEQEIEASQRRLADSNDLSRLNASQRQALTQQNNIENARQAVLNSLFKTQLDINDTYNKSLRKSDEILAALERERGLLTESAYITAKANEERSKANAEFDKARAQVIEDLKKQLGAGEASSIFGPDAQQFFEKLDPKILQDLLDEFEKAGGDVSKANDAYAAFAKALRDNAKISDVYKNNILQSLSNLGPKGAGGVRDVFRSASESKRTAEAARDNAISNINLSESNQKQSTELENLTRSTSINAALLNKSSGVIKGTSTAFDGAAAYAYLVEVEQAKLVKSISDLQLQQAFEITNAEDKIRTDIRLTELRNAHAEQLRGIIGVDGAAQIAASNLNEETNKRVFDLRVQAKNAALKLQTDTKILDAETDLINAYNNNYGGAIQQKDINAKLSNALAKSTRSEQEKDSELQVQIGLIRKNWQVEDKDTERKTALLKERNKQIDIIDEAISLEKRLNLEAEQLIEARRKASASLRLTSLEGSIKNEIGSSETKNLQEIERAIVRGGALEKAGVESNFEEQARASVIKRRMAGRTNVDLRESTNILTGRDNSIQQNLEIQRGVLLDQAQTFQQIIGKQTPQLFADGMAEAMQLAINGADDLGDALRNVALNFLKNLQSAFLQSASRQIVASILPTGKAQGGYIKGYASGGLVTGGSGYKDDVPAMLSEGEYVIRKSSVNKYGASNLQKLNSGEAPKFADGGIFLPGVRGQGQISGYKDLTAFAKQTTTSGATDVLAGGATTAFANLEDQSSRLSAYALMREDDTINQEIRSAQEQAMNIIAEREAYRTAERKAFQKQLVSTVASAALSYGVNAGVGKLGSLFNSAAPVPKEMSNLINDSGFDYSNFGNIGYQAAGKTVDQGLSFGNFADGAAGVLKSLPSYQAPRTQSIYSNTRTRMLGSKGYPFMAYGGAVKRYNAGGPTDDIPALLMGGEYVMNRQATKKYGKQFFDSINQGRAPRFADGGQVSTSEPSFAEKAAAMSDSKATGGTNVNINISVTGQTSQTQTEGEAKQDGIDYKKMSKEIEQIVLKTITEQKRAGGLLKQSR